VDLYKTIRELLDERDRLDAIIARLERMQSGEVSTKDSPRRGRKSMGPDERREVSERMRRYWESRRGVNGEPSQ
jgi:hypothetical protein